MPHQLLTRTPFDGLYQGVSTNRPAQLRRVRPVRPRRATATARPTRWIRLLAGRYSLCLLSALGIAAAGGLFWVAPAFGNSFAWVLRVVALLGGLALLPHLWNTCLAANNR